MTHPQIISVFAPHNIHVKLRRETVLFCGTGELLKLRDKAGCPESPSQLHSRSLLVWAVPACWCPFCGATAFSVYLHGPRQLPQHNCHWSALELWKYHVPWSCWEFYRQPPIEVFLEAELRCRATESVLRIPHRQVIPS